MAGEQHTIMVQERDEGQAGRDNYHNAPPVFTLFPKLPPELQKSIIKFALPPPRYIELIFRFFNRGVEPAGFWAPTHVPNPSILLVSKDVRKEALSYLKPLKGRAKGCHTIYVNPSVDVFCLTNHRHHPYRYHDVDLQAVLTQLGGCIPRLAVDFEFASNWFHLHSNQRREELKAQRAENTPAYVWFHFPKCGVKELLITPWEESLEDSVYCFENDERAIVGFEEDESILEMVDKMPNDQFHRYGDFAKLAKEWMVEGGYGQDVEMPQFVFGRWVMGEKMDRVWIWRHQAANFAGTPSEWMLDSLN